MSGGRTVWRAKDAGWWRREWIVALGEEFGAAGPAVIDWLECEAKAQNDGGLVKAGPRTVARGAFVDVVTVGHVLSRAVTLGLLIDYRESDGRFICRIAWWQADQEKAMASARKQRQRNGATTDPDDTPPLSRSVTNGHGESRPVTKSPLKGQDSIKDTSSLRSEVVAAAPPPTEDEIKREEQVAFLCQLLSAEVRSTHGVAATSKEALPIKGWHDVCRSMLDRDGLTVEQIEHAIRWVCRHHYWRNRVKSMTRLRSEWAQVTTDMQQRPASGATVLPIRPRRETASDWLDTLAEPAIDATVIDGSEAAS